MNFHDRYIPTKVCIVAVALTSAIAWGCAYRVKDASRTHPTESYVGWVRFVGEFVLYDDRSAFDGSKKEHCISGALPLEKQRTAAETMNGRRVKVTGTHIAWSLPDPLAISLNNNGSPILNWCGGDFVIFATDIVAE